MRRPSRAFCATVSRLEGRSLQATLAPPPADPDPDYVAGFGIANTASSSQVPTQVVSQRDRTATVLLARSKSWTNPDDLPLLNVRVRTDPASPSVGVNVGAVDRTVTFAPGRRFASLAVPIIPGAPNPGEVDVTLTMTPADPPQDIHITTPVMTLKVLGSGASVAPAIVATNGTPQGIELVFNTSMDPARASNVKNYAAIASGLESEDDLFPSKGSMGKSVARGVPLKSAVYDADTNTVTLIPRRRLNYGGPNGQPFRDLFVTQGRRTRAARGPNGGTGAASGLVDVTGRPVQQSSRPPRPPGTFRVLVVGSLRPVYPGE